MARSSTIALKRMARSSTIERHIHKAFIIGLRCILAFPPLP